MNRCQPCDRTFATPSSLKRHISARNSSKSANHGGTRSRHQCPHCHAYFARGETVRRHVRSKHEDDLCPCPFCLKQFRAGYIPIHNITCGKKYWQKVEQHANLDNADAAQKDNLHFRIEELSEAPDESHTLRIIHENKFDNRLAADALTHALLWFEENGKVESYKAALATALRLNITVSIMEETREPDDRFYRLFLIVKYFYEIVRGVREVNDQNNDLGTTILHAACREGFAEILEPLYWRGACFDAVGRFDETPLEGAIRSGNLDTVRYALALGSDPNLDCPLLDALKTRRHDIITLLLNHGADINEFHGDYTILSAAVENCDLEQVRLALSLGADPNVAHPMDYLIDVCMWGDCYDCVHEEMARLLVEHGADVVRQSLQGYTVVHYAAMYCSGQLLRMALDRIHPPMFLDIVDCYQDTPLHYATQAFRMLDSQQVLSSISMLLEAGADPNVQNMDGQSPLMVAAMRGNDEIVKLLLDAGANGKSRCHRGKMALSYAVDRGHGTTIGLLLEKTPRAHEDREHL